MKRRQREKIQKSDITATAVLGVLEVLTSKEAFKEWFDKLEKGERLELKRDLQRAVGRSFDIKEVVKPKAKKEEIEEVEKEGEVDKFIQEAWESGAFERSGSAQAEVIQ